jgi:hypothetical protein
MISLRTPNVAYHLEHVIGMVYIHAAARYFNAGVMVVSTEAVAEEQEAMLLMLRHGGRWRYADQVCAEALLFRLYLCTCTRMHNYTPTVLRAILYG